MAGTTLISNPDSLPLSENKLEAPSSAETDLWIFRDGKSPVSGPGVVLDLKRRISASAHSSRPVLDALIEAGELEAALADAASSDAATASKLTDELALALCTGSFVANHAMQLLEQLHPPSQISISPPEGFTYYALHPLDFAHLVSRIPDQPRACALIGIRSIGTTLSAMCAAALQQVGRAVSRITVRPTGHPYSRQTEFSDAEIKWIGEQLALPAQFLIVDEGPGRSGSTFLSVAEALIRAGVPNQSITILGSREPNPESLCANNAAYRWKNFRFLSTTPSVNTRFERCTYVGSGQWREFMLPETMAWPESWTQMERLKFISPDRKSLFKFEGMGPLGAEVRDRAFMLADSGFSPRVRDIGDGFLEYELLQGTPATPQLLTTTLLQHMARYCVFRQSNFAAQPGSSSELKQMLEYNVRQELGAELQLPEDAFASQARTLCDGRMQPYEWIATGGLCIKTDAISHGDDHFFPGPCDIAWDLAGIAVEWKLDSNARTYLVSEFQRQTRGTVLNLPIYMLAYSVFRLGFCKMGISTVLGSPEEQRLRSAYQHYREIAGQLLEQLACTGLRLKRAA